MADFATLPGGLQLADNELVAGSLVLPPQGSFDRLILAFGGNDSLEGGLGRDWLAGGDDADVLKGGSGNDALFGDAGLDVVEGGSGNDFLFGGADADTLDGGSGNDTQSGGTGFDNVSGGAGSDVLLGDAGNDSIAGGSGDDSIIGGTGNDQLAGNSGADTFYFQSGFGQDVVLDFRSGADTLAIQANINGLAITTPADLATYITGQGGSSVITLGSDTIRLVGVSRADLISHLNDYVRIV